MILLVYHRLLLVLAGLALAAGFSAAAEKAPEAVAPPRHEKEDWLYLDNGTLKIGVLRSSGAALAWLSASGSKQNLLNHYDRGRLVQQSYYGAEDGSFWGKTPWRYNPVQGGDYQGQGARLTELKSDATSLYARSIPRHWATGEELGECVLEQWIRLEGALLHARFQMTWNGKGTHPPRHQEIPAVFVEASLATLVSYEGEAPWTGGAWQRRQPGARNEYFKMTEHWAAWVNEQGFGVGIYVPVASEATCYRFPGAEGSACSYIAPITTFALTPGLKFSYEAWLTIGQTEELRARFAALRK